MVIELLTPEILKTIFLPSLFVANIAAITLSGQFFKPVDDHIKSTMENRIPSNHTGLPQYMGILQKRNELWTEKTHSNNIVIRTIWITAIFVISELLLVGSLAVSFLWMNSLSDLFPSGVIFCINLAFFLFCGGIVAMLGLLIANWKRYFRDSYHEIHLSDVKKREN